jgi:hypothetical protein
VIDKLARLRMVAIPEMCLPRIAQKTSP